MSQIIISQRLITLEYLEYDPRSHARFTGILSKLCKNQYADWYLLCDNCHILTRTLQRVAINKFSHTQGRRKSERPTRVPL